MKKFSQKEECAKSGQAVILIVGVLAVLMLIAVCFAINARLELLAAKNYLNSIKAKYLAQAGINHAIAELKNDARSNFAYNDNVSISGEQSLGEGVYTVDIIEDEARRININNTTEIPNLAQILKNLRNYLGSSLTDTDCDNIVANAPYETKQEIMTISGIADTKYNEIKDYITVHSYKDPNCSNRSPININTAQTDTLKAVLEGISDGATTISSSDVTTLATDIQADITANGSFAHPDGWKRFKDLVDSSLSSTNKTEVIVNNCNPNSDKTGLTVSTTEFIFSSGGYYSIVATGTVREDGVGVSEKKLKTIVKIYDIWNQTTKEQFADENAVPLRVNWKNSCPINYDCLKTHIYNPDGAVTVDNALKIGFWENFTESNFQDDYGTGGTDTGDWVAVEETFSINEGGDGLFRTWPDGTFVDGVDYFPKVELDDSKWRFDDFSIRARIIDETSGVKNVNRDNLPWPAVPGGDGSPWWGVGTAPVGSCPDPPGPISTCCHEQYMNVGHLQFGDTTDYAGNPCDFSAIYLGFPQTYYGEWVDYLGDGYIYFGPPPNMKPESIVTNPHLYVAANYWGTAVAEWNTMTFSVPGYKSDKTFQFRSKGQRDLEGVVYYSGGSTSFDASGAPLMTFEDRYIRITGMGNLPDADNIRIIPQDPGGSYVSIDYDIGETIEQGTVSGTVTLLDTVHEDTRVELSSGPGSSTSVEYQADFYSMDDDIEDTPVLEDVFVTYFKPTKILYYTEVKN